MASESWQRAYRAPCPGCGAPVEFRSAQSTHAVCNYCQSTVVRNGDTLSRIGKMAELFNDFSPLQLHAAGVWQGQSFVLVGRLQYQYAQGTWTEWYALLDDGSAAFLSEDNGAYVFSQSASLQREVPSASDFRVGAATAINGKTFSVASNEQVSLLAAQGELPRLPSLGQPFAMVELRSPAGEVLSVDYGLVAAGGAPVLALGHAVLLDDLKLTGLKDESAKDESAQAFNCPQCGSPVQLRLSSSKSITCNSCNSIIDVSDGTGARLQHAIQEGTVVPLIALGSIGQMQGAQWQVVGFQHRIGREPDDTEAVFSWDEYLLYNQGRGFIFLVDAQDGWSVVKPTTGAPVLKPGGQSATYLNTSYALQSSYRAETFYVTGEFYWQVKRGQTTFNRDFVRGTALLSQEETPNEVTWFSGSRLSGDVVAKGFGQEADKALFQRASGQPLSSAAGMSVKTIVFVVVLALLLIILISRCTRCDPKVENCSSSSGYRTSGGAFGGFSGGGGHK